MSPSKWRIRRVFRPVIERMAVPLARVGVPPDTVTLTSLLFAFLAVLGLLVTKQPVLYGVLAFIVGLLDGLDGAVARLSDHKTDYGAFLDSITDRVTDIMLLSGIALAYSNEKILGIDVSTWVILCISGWIMTSYTRCRAADLGVSDLDIGPGGRSERLFVLVMFAITGHILLGLVVVTVLGVATAGYRVTRYGRELQRRY